MRRINGRYATKSALPYTGYVEPVAAGDTITWGEWSKFPTADRTWPITLFPYSSGSDYSGSTVEQSNYRVLCDDTHVMRRSVIVEGNYSTFGVAYLGHPTRKIREICAALDGYTLLDESDHSELETEIEQKQWQEWGRADFRREIADAFEGLDLDVLEASLGTYQVEHGSDKKKQRSVLDRLLDGTWHSFSEQHGDGGRIFEAPDSCHFYIDDAIAWLQKERTFGDLLVLGHVTYEARHALSVARDASQEGKPESVVRALLKQATSYRDEKPTIVRLHAPCDECGERVETRSVDTETHRANVCATCVPEATE